MTDAERMLDELGFLCRCLYYCNMDGKDCDGCAMNGADMGFDLSDTSMCDGVNRMMRELAIGAEGGC